MKADDAFLQTIYAEVRRDLAPATARRIRHIHVYPSRRCSYTISKQRIFLRTRDDSGKQLPACVLYGHLKLKKVRCPPLRHVLLHELAHVMNRTHGHDGGFRSWFSWLLRQSPKTCPHRVPTGYNPCTSS
jgi:hypothetical protein